jgi:hypothetical protein
LAGTGNIKLIFDEFQRGGGSAVGGGSGGRDEAMRLALQKKRWIEMQLHEVQLQFIELHISTVGFHLAPHVLPLHSTQDIRNVPAADRKRRD